MTSTPGGSGGTPWWERKEAELREKSSAADDATCSISSSETVRDDRFFFSKPCTAPSSKARHLTRPRFVSLLLPLSNAVFVPHCARRERYHAAEMRAHRAQVPNVPWKVREGS